MRVLSKEFIDAFPNQIINIHPSLLPKYKGLHAIEQTFESNDTLAGCTVHMVTEELDSGKILEQSAIPIEVDDTIESLTERIHREEYRILPLAIDRYAKS